MAKFTSAQGYPHSNRRRMFVELLNTPNDLVARSVVCDWIEEFFPIGDYRENSLFAIRKSIERPSALCIGCYSAEGYYIELVFKHLLALPDASRSYNIANYCLLYELNNNTLPPALLKMKHFSTLRPCWYKYNDEYAVWDGYLGLDDLQARL